MDAKLRRGRLWIGGLHGLWGPVLVLAVLAGCAQPKKTSAPQPAKPQATESVTPAKPAPAAPGPAPDKLAPCESAAKKANAAKAPAAAQPAAAPAKKESHGAPESPAKEATPQPADQPAGAPQGQKQVAPAPELTPPPADQPQPKAVCKQTKVVAAPVWQGKTAEFTFTLSNEGQAPLAIRVKPT